MKAGSKSQQKASAEMNQPGVLKAWLTRGNHAKTRAGDLKGASRQIPVYLPATCSDGAKYLQMPGPACASAPDGAIWSTLLGGEGQVIRIGKDGKKSRYELPPDKEGWMAGAKYIHMQFVMIPERWYIFNDEKWVFPKTNNLLLISSTELRPAQS